ncbi:M23 family metallopeptidase [Haloplasma contractile]|uniref:Cell wall endopeptidase family M23-M37 protein n=1 Tax=Haloplasma contractile SSD-17B TaxID=1033810 RepID=U2FJJ7_9MOLU|nr:M23 family metallopeptidase [Haloplasma contractile]ERJ11434.1 Cell wall endopeptidase family M23-M37 protein [Haloplasma contractile SSD-17B]
MKEKFIDVVFKKFQAYSFIIFLALVLGAFFALNQLNKGNNVDEPDTPPVNGPVDSNPDDTGDDSDDDGDTGDDVTQLENEIFMVPVASESNPTIQIHYYSANLEESDQLSAIIKITETMYTHSTGTVYTVDGTQAFDVTASLTGTVTNVSSDSFMGNSIEIEHVGGIKTVYYGLSSISAVEGEKVDQGDKIGKSGNNSMFNGNGVYFEVIQGALNLNPETLIEEETPVSDLIE